jgi:hypothetical protein
MTGEGTPGIQSSVVTATVSLSLQFVLFPPKKRSVSSPPALFVDAAALLPTRRMTFFLFARLERSLGERAQIKRFP